MLPHRYLSNIIFALPPKYVLRGGVQFPHASMRIEAISKLTFSKCPLILDNLGFKRPVPALKKLIVLLKAHYFCA